MISKKVTLHPALKAKTKLKLSQMSKALKFLNLSLAKRAFLKLKRNCLRNQLPEASSNFQIILGRKKSKKRLNYKQLSKLLLSLNQLLLLVNLQAIAQYPPRVLSNKLIMLAIKSQRL